MYCTNCGKDQTFCRCEEGVRHLAPRPRSVASTTVQVVVVLVCIVPALVIGATLLGDFARGDTPNGVIWLAVLVGVGVAVRNLVLKRRARR